MKTNFPLSSKEQCDINVKADNLAQRWQDEYKYEPITSYHDAFIKKTGATNATILTNGNRFQSIKFLLPNHPNTLFQIKFTATKQIMTASFPKTL